MDNEIFRMTLSDIKFASVYNIEASEKKKWGIFFATFFCNFFLIGILLSYGIILSSRLFFGVPLPELLAAPCLFCVAWSFADPWFRDIADSLKHGISTRTFAFAGVFISCLGMASCTIAQLHTLHVISFGLLGGIGTSLVLSQINYVITDVFQVNTSKVKLLGQYGQAMGQSTVPYFILVIFHFYGHSMGYLLVSGLVLQLLPLVLFVKNAYILPVQNSNRKSYVRKYSQFEDDASLASERNDVQLVDLSKKSWRSPSDENLSKHQDDDGDEYEEVEISIEREMIDDLDRLPPILEESEHSESDESNEISDSSNKSDKTKMDKKKINDDIKRFSVISDKLDEIIVKSEIIVDGIPETNNNQTKTLNDSIEIESIDKPIQNAIVQIPSVNNNSESKKEQYSFVRRTSGQSLDWQDNAHLNCSRNTQISCCSSYSWYRTKRKCRNALDYTKDTFIKPLKMSFKTIQFYPAVMLKTCNIFIPFCASSLMALLANDVHPKLKTAELATVISTHGIAWIIFLILSPWITAIAKSKFKYVAASGCFASAVGYFVLMDSNGFKFMVLGSAISGVGYGAISTTCEEAMRNCIGLRKWSILRGTLDGVAGVIVALLGIYMSWLLSSDGGLTNCFGVLITLLSVSGLMWTVIPLIVAIRKNHNVQHLWPEF